MKKNWEGVGVRPRKCPHLGMNPWKKQTLQWRIGFKETCLISAVTSGPTEPKTLQEAWHCQNEKERNNWRTAIRKEMRSMMDREVWRKTERKKIPSDRRLIGNKWVFKIKRDGTYRARLVAFGHSQIPVIDYTDNFCSSCP